MAQSLTVAMENPYADMCDANTITLDWVSGNAGDGDGGEVTQSICAVFAAAVPPLSVSPQRIRGFIRSIETIPGASGDLATAVPTLNYDITITDPYGYDVIAGEVANRSNAVAEKKVPTSPIYVNSELVLNIENAGDTKQGRILLHVIPDSRVA